MDQPMEQTERDLLIQVAQRIESIERELKRLNGTVSSDHAELLQARGAITAFKWFAGYTIAVTSALVGLVVAVIRIVGG